MLPAASFRTGFVVLLLSVAPSRAAEPNAPSPEGVAFFEKRIRPLLVLHCYECHSAESKKVKGEFRLDTRAATLEGGTNGPALIPGDPNASLLIKAVRHVGDLKMPPKQKLAANEIADLEAWVKMGAPDPRTSIIATIKKVEAAEARQSWPYRAVRKPSLPAVKDAAWPHNEIDRFILAKLEEKQLRPMPAAAKRTLIRRATYDLTGLPPTPGEIEQFLNESVAKPQAAYEALVDRLLSSPAYGERWGRHWLDVVRYADTAGDNSDYPVPQHFRYRNWVIDAFNRDLPYDEFVRQQIAGDLLMAADEADRHAKLIATGYLANARRFGSYEEARYPWHLTIEDTIDNLGRTFLGLTINCCRCHDHKFDPLSQEDYYALYGFFQSTRYPRPGIELDKVQRDFVPLAPREQVATLEKERHEKLAEFDARIKRLEDERMKTEKALKDAEKGPDEKKRQAAIAELGKRMRDQYQGIKDVRKQAEDFGKKQLPFETAYAVAEGKNEGKRKVGNACVQIKGDPERLGVEVPRRFPTVLGGQKLSADNRGSGRLELANWIADAGNPLTARVMVNRIWQHHFGKGIVPTPSDFGRQGRPATHPELLDYLAARFVESGWSIKAMHRLIMLSRTYQIGSTDDEANYAIDIANDYLWRFNRQRLDAESIRDSIMSVSGTLNRAPGTAHPFPGMPTWNFTQHNPFKAVYDTDRRSIYLMTQRIQRHPFLTLFDGPDTNASTSTRITSTSSLQALYLMNDPFVHAQSRKLALRLLSETADESARVDRAFLLLFGRRPSAAERTAATDHVAHAAEKLRETGVQSDLITEQAWQSLARALFLSNEFVYVD